MTDKNKNNFNKSLNALLTTHASVNPNVQQLRQQIALQCPTLNDKAWWLLGTLGCHLCDKAENLLNQFKLVTPITYQKLDIIMLDEDIMAQFAAHIPVLLTPMQRLDYPFSILDLHRLAGNE